MRIIFLTLIICLIAIQAHACTCINEDNKRLEKIGNAAFIGIFEVLESSKAEFKSDGGASLNGKPTQTEHGTAYRIRPLATYKGSLPTETVYVNHNNGCNPSAMESGKIYRGVVIRNKYDVLTLPSTCTYVTREEWSDFEKQASVTEEWKNFESQCKREGKIIRDAGEMRCSKKTGDKGKVCKDGSECEGFCAVPYSEYEYAVQDLMDRTEGKSMKRPATGKCSEWADSSDGMLVEHGYTGR